MKKFLTISEMAKYAGISRRTLIYYDQIDLFKPAKVGENGYRYYGIDQYFELDVILLLKKSRRFFGGYTCLLKKSECGLRS